MRISPLDAIRNSPARRFGLLTALTSVAVLSGCFGPSGRTPTGGVSGTVTLDGQPLAEGVILLCSPGNRLASGKIRNGQIVEVMTYESDDGAPVGEHQVAIQPAVHEGPMTVLKPTDGPFVSRSSGGYMSEETSRNRTKARAPQAPPGSIPFRYRTPTTSDLTATIIKGDNQLKLVLTTDP